MSVDASIDIQLVSRSKHHIIDLIKSLLAEGWQLNNKIYGRNKISYLPIGDQDEFNWKSEERSMIELEEIINQKEKLKEMVGIRMYWGETEIGIDLLIYSGQEFSAVLDIKRKIIDGADRWSLTDVNWYLEHIIGALRRQTYFVEGFTFTELQ